MKLLVAIDHHFLRGPDGAVYLGPPMSIPGYQFWKRYLSVFEEVEVLARVSVAEQALPSTPRCDGPAVTFHDLPDYLGPWEYLSCYRRLKAEVEKAVEWCDAFILRVPGAVGQLAWKAIRKRRLPFGLEVVADPWDLLAPGATRSVVRPLVRRGWSKHLRQMCAEASAVCYVTREALQKRYPPGPSTWVTYASDVELPEGVATESQLDARKARLAAHFSENGCATRPLRIGFLGSLSQLYKAPDVLIRAVATCYHHGSNLDLFIAGDGKFRRSLEKMAADLGLADRVRFCGALSPGRQVLEFLDELDLFVLPSRQEGLPRAMVEAMSRGCPCLGSTVGGIPELLPADDLVAPGDEAGLARKITDVISDLERMERMSVQNWERAKGYGQAALSIRRQEFYRRARELALASSLTVTQPNSL